MGILKDRLAWGGAPTGFHRVTEVTTQRGGAGISATVSSWPTQAVYESGAGPISRSVHALAIAPSATIFEDAEAALLLDPEWAGGIATSEAATSPLDAAKARRWGEIKMMRNAAEFGGFSWGGSRFDSDIASQLKITGAAAASIVSDVRWLQACVHALAAQSGVALPQPQVLEVDWTLADNTSRTLAGADLVDVGLALLGHDNATHTIGRQLRAIIEAAESPEALSNIVWPAG